MSLLHRRMIMVMGTEGETVKEWKLLETRILESTTDFVEFDFPSETQEVSIVAKTMQERSDGEALTSMQPADIYIDNNLVLGKIANFSGYTSSITAFAHLENIGAYVEGLSAAITDSFISKNAVYPCRLIKVEEIGTVKIAANYRYVSGFGNVGRFSIGSEFTVYYR